MFQAPCTNYRVSWMSGNINKGSRDRKPIKITEERDEELKTMADGIGMKTLANEVVGCWNCESVPPFPLAFLRPRFRFFPVDVSTWCSTVEEWWWRSVPSCRIAGYVSENGTLFIDAKTRESFRQRLQSEFYQCH